MDDNRFNFIYEIAGANGDWLAEVECRAQVLSDPLGAPLYIELEARKPVPGSEWTGIADAAIREAVLSYCWDVLGRDVELAAHRHFLAAKWESRAAVHAAERV